MARWSIDMENNIIAEIDLRYVGYEGPDGPEIYFEDLTPHMEILTPQSHQEGDTMVVDVGILKALFLDDQPDAFGDLNG